MGRRKGERTSRAGFGAHRRRSVNRLQGDKKGADTRRRKKEEEDGMYSGSTEEYWSGGEGGSDPAHSPHAERKCEGGARELPVCGGEAAGSSSAGQAGPRLLLPLTLADTEEGLPWIPVSPPHTSSVHEVSERDVDLPTRPPLITGRTGPVIPDDDQDPSPDPRPPPVPAPRVTPPALSTVKDPQFLARDDATLRRERLEMMEQASRLKQLVKMECGHNELELFGQACVAVDPLHPPLQPSTSTAHIDTTLEWENDSSSSFSSLGTDWDPEEATSTLPSTVGTSHLDTTREWEASSSDSWCKMEALQEGEDSSSTDTG